MMNLAFKVGTQLFSMAYAHISPVSCLMFGWKMRVLKWTYTLKTELWYLWGFERIVVAEVDVHNEPSSLVRGL